MEKEKKYKILYWSIFIFGLLLVLIVPSLAASAAREGTLTIQRFRVEDYENLRESTGHSKDITDVPTGAETIMGVEYTLEKLSVSVTDIEVNITTPIDTSFPARVQITDENGKTVFTNLPEGYYLVTEATPSGQTAMYGRGFVVRIPNTLIDANGNETVNYDVVLYPKGQQVTVEKRVNDERKVVGVDDIVSWTVEYLLGADLKREETINGKIETFYGKNFYLTDEMDTRLDYIEGSVDLSYYDAKGNRMMGFSLQEGIDYHLSYDTSTHILTIAFTDDVGTKKVADAQVATIQMYLETKVNSAALHTVIPIWNNARISFENALGDPYEHEVFPSGTNPEDNRVPKVYPGQIIITKVDAADRSQRLVGATFYLADSEENAEAGKFLTRSNTQGRQEEITITTDATGEATISAIGAGTYYLVETIAPKGYYKLTDPIEVTVANDESRNSTQLEISNIKEGTIPKEPEEPTDNPPGADGGKGFASGVKTGDVVRMTGILLLAIASGGTILSIIRRAKEKRKAMQE